MRLRQVMFPAEKATWIEYFYSGELKVENNEVETDNPDWIATLIAARGFRPVDELESEEEVQVLGDVYSEKEHEPLGTDIARLEDPEHVEELIEESYEAAKEDQEEEKVTAETVDEDTENEKDAEATTVDEPAKEEGSLLEQQMNAALHEEPVVKTPRRRSRKRA